MSLPPLHDAEAAALASDIADAPAPPDPFPLSAILRAAVDAAKARHGYASDAAVAREAKMSPQALHRALTATGRATSPETLRRVLRVAGMRVGLLPDGLGPGWFADGG